MNEVNVADYLRVVESFYSLQGEGLHVGVPSVFLRLSGCNFKCQGFGMPSGAMSNAYRSVDPTQYAHLKDLPVVSTGCDSYPAWDPRCQHLTQKLSVAEVAETLVHLTPEKSWMSAEHQPIHLVITGGEPLLAWQKAISVLLALPVMQGLRFLSFETNATQPLQAELLGYLNGSNPLEEVLFTCSPKLSNSGEARDKAICPNVIKQYAGVCKAKVVCKFVVQSEACFDEIKSVVRCYQDAGVRCRVYCMPEGSQKTSWSSRQSKLALLALSNGFSYSPRLHVDLWNNAWET